MKLANNHLYYSSLNSSTHNSYSKVSKLKALACTQDKCIMYMNNSEPFYVYNITKSAQF